MMKRNVLTWWVAMGLWCIGAAGCGAKRAGVEMDHQAAEGGGRGSFAQIERRARAGEPIRVVFFGGSLSWGANASDPNRTSWRGLMMRYLTERYPRTPWRFHDACIGGTGSALGLFRLERDVLAHEPDLVFLEFTVNDGIFGADVPTLAMYERILRELVERDVAVMQVFTVFQWEIGKPWVMSVGRYAAHLKLAEAYGSAIGDARAHAVEAIEAGEVTADAMWPLDASHPCDLGYQVFFEGVRRGWERAVAQGASMRLPAQTVYDNLYPAYTRHVLVDHALPAGWTRELTYRTSKWFDGLSSRWMGDVAVCDIEDRGEVEPLRIEFQGTRVALFGEKDENTLDFEVFIDGRRLPGPATKGAPPPPHWSVNTGEQGGRLFSFVQLTDALEPGGHVLEIRPIMPEGVRRGQLRIESVMFAGPQ